MTRQAQVAAVLAALCCSVALGHPVDTRRTSHGGPEPFSTRHHEPPAPAAYDDLPVTDDVSFQAWRFSEPGLNQSLHAPLGLLLFQGQSGSRPQWVIYDMLAWTPMRHLLHQEPGPWMAMPSHTDGPASQHLPRATFTQPPSPQPQSPQIVPLPTTAMLMAAGLLLILPRRPKRR